MRQQQQIWEKEHATEATLSEIVSDTPSSFVVKFRKYLQEKSITPPGKVIDIGCGKGRNAIYFAKEGFETYAMDYIEHALNIAKKHTEKENLSNIHFILHDIGTSWPFPDHFFDIAVDCFSSIDIEDVQNRTTCRDEMYRTLRPGGLAFVGVVSSEDEMEKELIRTSPGPEKNSSIWPSGKFQKNYDEEELREFYKKFTILELQKLTKQTSKLGKKYTAVNFWMVLQKNG